MVEEEHQRQTTNPPESSDWLELALRRTISRRQLLKLAPLAVFGFMGVDLVLEKIAGAYIEQQKDWETAALSNDEFLITNRNLMITASFSPEQLDSFGQSIKHEDALRFAEKELGITDFRLGIRWNRVVDDNSQINLEYYKPTLDYCLDGKKNVTLNAGLLKVFRWPEIHIPDFVLDNLNPKPPQGTQIESGTDLANKAREHTQRFYDSLGHSYSAEELSHIVTIQADNEAREAFGDERWTIHPLLVKEGIDLALQYFPNANILVNCGNILNQREVTRLLEDIKQNGKVKGKVISGVDYYPRNSYLPAEGMPDSIGLAKAMAIFNLNPLEINRQSKVDEVELTEGQLEPWTNNPKLGEEALTRPGNSVREARYMLLRANKNILRTGQPSRAGVWGIERLVYLALTGQMTNEHKQIIDLIQKINFQQAA